MVNVNKQPLRGLIPLLMVVIFSLVFILVAENIFHIGPGWEAIYALFFVWMAFVVSLAGRWPLAKYKQPWVGIAFLSAAMFLGVLHPYITEWLGYDKLALAWPLISNLFLGVGIIVALGNYWADGLKQPAALFANAIFMYVFAIILLLWIGFVPAIWFAFFVFVFFWLETWPVQNAKQPGKGVFLFAIMGLFSVILWYLFVKVGYAWGTAEAGLWFVLWVFMLVATSWELETWPLQKVKQPLKGIGGLIITLPLTFIAYYLIVDVFKMNAGDAGMYVWVFTSWLYSWDILFGKWPAERPTKAAEPAKAPEADASK